MSSILPQATTTQSALKTPVASLTALSAAKEKLQFNALAKTTRATYSTGVKQYLYFCSQHNLCPQHNLCLLPPIEQTIALFITSLAQQLRGTTISVYMVAIRMFFLEHGFSSPFTNFDQLQLVMRGIKHQQGQHPNNQRLLITKSITVELNQAVSHFNLLSNHDKLTLWAALTTAFFGCLRASEYTCAHKATLSHTVRLRDSSWKWSFSTAKINLLTRNRNQLQQQII